MRILLASFIDPASPCGVWSYYRLLQEGLQSAGHDVRLVTPSAAPRAVRWLSGAFRRMLGQGGPYANLVAQELKCWWRVRAASRALAWRPDVVHAQDVGSASAAAVFGPACPVLVTAHFNDDPVGERLISVNIDGHPARWLRRRMARQFALCRDYVAPSRYAADGLRRWAPAGSAIAVVPNACDVAGLSAARPAADVCQRAGGRRIMLSAGTLEPRKDPRFLIDVAAALAGRQDLMFMHAGDGPLRSALEAEVAARQLTNLQYLGQRADLAAVMKSAALFVHFPLRETFGLVVIEAMAAGVPVLARAVGGIPDILSDVPGRCLYAVDTPSARVAADLAALADDPARGEALVAGQRRLVRARYDTPIFIETMLAMYRRLMGSAEVVA